MRLQRLQVVTRSLILVAAAASAAGALLAAVAAEQYVLAAGVLVVLMLRLLGTSAWVRDLGAAGLVLMVAAIVGAVSGPSGPLLVALLFVVTDFAFLRAPGFVLTVAMVATAVAAGASSTLAGHSLDSADLWALVLVPLVGLLASRMASSASLDGTAALESATTALDEVLRLAERMPAGFDRWAVATAVHQELEEGTGLGAGSAVHAHLLLVQHGVLFGVAAPVGRRPAGFVEDLPRARRGRVWTPVATSDLPPQLSDQLGGHRWLLHRLGQDGAYGIVLVPHGLPKETMVAVGQVLRPAAVALANVHRFERLEDLALSAARVRVAHDLHDGVAQSLTHVRFELDLLGLEHEELADELERIRQVADEALLEVRRTVDELREAQPLVARLQAYVELLSTFVSPSIRIDVGEDVEVDDAVGDDVFRIAQEALSNAVRHAQAETILVSLNADGRDLTLDVVDDGIGIDTDRRRGVGLGGMRSRARRLGGEVLVRPRHEGGTVVHLSVPLPEFPPPDATTDRDFDGASAPPPSARSRR